jgi:hypothetical protein
MTEDDWVICADPKAMLDFVGRKATERKLRLFACACCRRNWHLISDEARRNAVEQAEAYADGLVTNDTLHHAWLNAAKSVDTGIGVSHLDGAIVDACWRNIAIGEAISLIDNAASAAAGGPPWDDAWMQARIPEHEKQASLLRDIFGGIFYTKNLFRPTLIEPKWLTSTVTSIVNHMYDSNDFGPMPILADSLEDAGCDEDYILNHCGNAGEHVRGCWVVDLLLGKN